MAKSMVNPCVVCTKRVQDNQRGIYCDCCHQWVHLKCTTLTVKDYSLLSNQTDNWFCQCCLQAIFPFNHFDDELDFINCIFTNAKCDKLNSLPIRNCTQLDIIGKLTAVDKKSIPIRI